MVSMETVKLLINNTDVEIPKYETSGSAGMDIRADLSRLSPQNFLKSYGDVEFNYMNKTITIHPNSRVMIPTGLHFGIPEGYLISIRSRSGLSTKTGLMLVNGVATIDSDYTGEVFLPFVNNGFEPVTIQNGERIAQILLEKSYQMQFEIVNELNETTRGSGGFGHTGQK